jgi:hypothetical protein
MPVLKKIEKSLLQFRNRVGILLYILISSWTVTENVQKSQAVSTKEYEIKAAFLLNFTRFIEWPDQSFALDKSPFIIGILGDDPFGDVLNEIISGEKVNGHPLIIQHYYSVKDIKTCHILFINTQNQESLSGVINSLKDQNTLTVSDIPDFASKGGMVGFFIENNKVRLRINLDQARASNLSIDSKLLRLAQIVSSKKD